MGVILDTTRIIRAAHDAVRREATNPAQITNPSIVSGQYYSCRVYIRAHRTTQTSPPHHPVIQSLLVPRPNLPLHLTQRPSHILRIGTQRQKLEIHRNSMVHHVRREPANQAPPRH